jgi:membrane-bound lytic murein transglycosylase B
MREERTLFATLCEVELGLFHVTYRVDGVGFGNPNLPRYEVGATASQAQRRIEQQARECGYSAVVWETAFAAVPPPPPSVRREAPRREARPSH